MVCVFRPRRGPLFVETDSPYQKLSRVVAKSLQHHSCHLYYFISQLRCFYSLTIPDFYRDIAATPHFNV